MPRNKLNTDTHRVCKECGELRPIEEFYTQRSPKYKNGFRYDHLCKKHRNEIQKRRYAGLPLEEKAKRIESARLSVLRRPRSAEKNREYQKRWQQRNPEKVAQKYRAWAARNQDKLREKQRRWMREKRKHTLRIRPLSDRLDN